MRRFVLALVFLLPTIARAQGVRIGDGQTIQQTATVGGTTNVLVVATNPTVNFCNSPANGAPCTNKATTYTDLTLSTTCPTSTQIVLAGTTTCVANPDAQGNWGVWAAPGQYAYTVTRGGATFGPYYVSAITSGISSVGLSLPSIFGVSGSPVTTAGTLTGTFNSQSANLIFSGPSSGAGAAPGFRSLVGADLPNPSATTLGGMQSFAPVTNQFLTAISTLGVPSAAQPSFSNLSGSISLGQTALISRGDLLTVNLTPALVRLAIGAANLYPKSNGADVVYSSLAAGGVGTCTNQVITALNADAAPTCTTLTSAFLPTAVVYNNVANTFTSAGTIDLSAASATVGLKIPIAAGAAPTTSGTMAYDSTGNEYRVGVNTVASKLPTFSGADPPTNNCVKWGANGTLVDQGAACAASSVVYSTASASTNASIAATTMATAGVSGNTYRFSAFYDLTVVGVGCTGSTTVAVNLTYTDPNTVSSVTDNVPSLQTNVASLALTGTIASAGNGLLPTMFTTFPKLIRAKASTAVQYSTTYTIGAGCTTGPSYQVFPILEQVN